MASQQGGFKTVTVYEAACGPSCEEHDRVSCFEDFVPDFCNDFMLTLLSLHC
jgi:hypothetical protein